MSHYGLISLMTNDVEHLFMWYWLVISFVNYLFTFFVHFLLDCIFVVDYWGLYKNSGYKFFVGYIKVFLLLVFLCPVL